MRERACEHLRDARRGDPDSHILDHKNESHPDADTQNLFEFKVLATYQSSFARQLGEAVKIMTFRGGPYLIRRRCLTDV